MTRSALDCFQRGVLSARANLGLVWMGLLQSLAVSVLFVASLVPPVLVLGGPALLDLDLSDPTALERWLGGLGATLAGRLPALALGLLASTLIGLLAVVVWGWFQGGIVGVLVAAERQAHPEAGRRSGGWRWFRTFSLQDFAGWGGRNLWRFFWWFHVMLTAWLAFSLLAVLLLAGAGVAWESWGGGAGFGLGCGGTFPLLFLFWVLAAWSFLSQPAVALPENGAWSGSVRGFRILGRRLGAASFLLLTVLVLSFALGILGTMVRLGFDLVLPDRLSVQLGVLGVVAVLQSLVAVALNLFAYAAYAALVIPETGSRSPEESR
ncbi:MAG: hypothetical protein PVG07_00465 [Acidobacteriota bacterium]|jgi:hypothetical protein